MNAQDNELVLRLAKEVGLLPDDIGPVVQTKHMKKKEDGIADFAARLKAAWLEQIESCVGLPPPIPDPQVSYQAGAASREPEIQALREELAEEEAIRERCAQLLAKTAVALKGEEAPLQRHGWQDLPEAAQALREEVERSYIDASNLATSIWRQFYQRTAPDWGVCDSTQGVISQLDNMFAGVRERLLAAQRSERKLRDLLELMFESFHGCVEGGDDDELMRQVKEALSTPTNTEELDALVKDAEQRGFVSGLNEATRLVRMWLKDPDVERMTETARDACRKVNFWPGWLEQAAIDAAIKAQEGK